MNIMQIGDVSQILRTDCEMIKTVLIKHLGTSFSCELGSYFLSASFLLFFNSEFSRFLDAEVMAVNL